MKNLVIFTLYKFIIGGIIPNGKLMPIERGDPRGILGIKNWSYIWVNHVLEKTRVSSKIVTLTNLK